MVFSNNSENNINNTIDRIERTEFLSTTTPATFYTKINAITEGNELESTSTIRAIATAEPKNEHEYRRKNNIPISISRKSTPKINTIKSSTTLTAKPEIDALRTSTFKPKINAMRTYTAAATMTPQINTIKSSTTSTAKPEIDALRTSTFKPKINTIRTSIAVAATDRINYVTTLPPMLISTTHIQKNIFPNKKRRKNNILKTTTIQAITSTEYSISTETTAAASLITTTARAFPRDEYYNRFGTVDPNSDDY